jgi:hypothetical protein
MPTLIRPSLVTVAILFISGCGDSEAVCPQEDYPTVYTGTVVENVRRGLDTTLGDPMTTSVSIRTEASTSEPEVLAYVFEIAGCEVRFREPRSCVDPTPRVIGLAPTDLPQTCEWTTGSGDHATLTFDSWMVQWGPDSLELNVGGDVVFTGASGTEMGEASFRFSSDP